MDEAAFFLFGADHKARMPRCQGMADLSQTSLSKWTHAAMNPPWAQRRSSLPSTSFGVPFMRRVFPVALLSLLVLAGSAISQPVPADYATLVEPDDREAVVIKPMQEKLAANPDDQATARALLLAYKQYGDFESGLPLGERLGATNPDDDAIFEARMLLAKRRIDEASLFGKKSAAADLLAMCEGERARAPRSVPALNCLAQYYLIAPSIVGGDKAKAEAAIAAMEGLDAGQYLLLRANLAIGNDDKASARALLLEAIPKLTEAADVTGAALVLGMLGDGEATLTALDRAALLDPADPLTLYQRGRAAALTGRNLEAGRDSLLRLLAGSAWINGTDYRASAHWRLGQIYMALDDKGTAEKAYRRALVLEPKHKEAQAALKALKSNG